MESSWVSRLSDEAHRALRRAYRDARDRGFRAIGTGHMLIGLIRGSRDCRDALLRIGVDPASAEAAARKALPTQPKSWWLPPGQLPLTRALVDACERADKAAQSLGSAQIGPVHLLVGLVLERHGVAAVAVTGACSLPTREVILRLVDLEMRPDCQRFIDALMRLSNESSCAPDT